MSKTCFKCNKEKPLEDFYKHPDTADGRLGKCKECTKRDVASNRLKRSEQYAEYERKRYTGRGHRYINYTPLVYLREWRKANPMKVKAYNANRRALIIAQAEGSFSPDEWVELCEAFDYECLACGEKKDLTVDHVIPLSKGGTNNIDNIQPICRSCNSKKGVKTIDYRKNVASTVVE